MSEQISFDAATAAVSDAGVKQNVDAATAAVINATIEASKDAFSVSELNSFIKQLFDAQSWLENVCVRGEISNYKLYPSGHAYFSVKDAESSLKCVMFKGAAQGLKFKPSNGMQVLVVGRVGVYPRDGAYQLYATRLTPDGAGDLHMAFEQLKTKLAAEGLFDSARKKPLPPFPERIAVITSSAGAAVRDIIRILGQRYPLAKVNIIPTRVQGADAPPEIAAALDFANEQAVADVIIVGRGGGSLEDLWAFNDERVAYAIARSVIPVISAVGHEPDVTIADFVADVRASTPSNAAELAVPDRNELFAYLQGANAQLARSLLRSTDNVKMRLKHLAGVRVLTSPLAYIETRRETLDRVTERLANALQGGVHSRGLHLSRLAAGLDAMSPLKVLSRGYAIATKGGKAVKAAADVVRGDKLNVRLGLGEIDCEVL
jgi:exodeoxyribonuclease VII large subunit